MLWVKMKEVRQFSVWDVSPHTQLLASVTVETLHYLSKNSTYPFDFRWERTESARLPAVCQGPEKLRGNEALRKVQD